MATKLYRYTTDKGRKYLVRLDAAVGDNPIFGFEKNEASPFEENKDLDNLPRKLTMRSIGAMPKTGEGSYRRFPVGKKSAAILATVDDFTYKGVQYTPRWFKPEKSRK